MKKGILALVILGAVAFIAYKVFNKNEESTPNPETPIAVKADDSLTLNLQNLMAGYFNLKDAFVKSDMTLVNGANTNFDSLLTGLKMDGQLQDEALKNLATDLIAQVKTSADGINKAADLETKRASFQTLSDALFDLLRSVQYHGGKVYQQYCPMAFDNKGAAWLSNSTDVINPYFGDKMLNCGELRDSIDIVVP